MGAVMRGTDVYVAGVFVPGVPSPRDAMPWPVGGMRIQSLCSEGAWLACTSRIQISQKKYRRAPSGIGPSWSKLSVGVLGASWVPTLTCFGEDKLGLKLSTPFPKERAIGEVKWNLEFADPAV